MSNTTPDALPPLVERLRDAVTQQRRSLYGPCDCMPLMDEAANAIERLTAERDALRDVIDGTLAQAVARLEKCEAERDAALAASRYQTDIAQQALEELAEAKAERNAALEDARRYRWIVDNATSHGGGDGFTLTVRVPFDIEDLGCAIDAALAAQKGDDRG